MATEGYFFVALGVKYITESTMAVLTIRKFGDVRPAAILVHPEHSNYVESLGVFDEVVEFRPSGKLWEDCATDFERYAVYPRITLDEYACYDHNIMLDTDVLCIHNPDRIWNMMRNHSSSIGSVGTRNDPSWHWGTINEVIEAYGKHIPHIHGGFFYFRKDEFLNRFMEYCREVFYRFDEYRCKKFFRSGKSEEIILAIGHSKFDLLPFEFTNNIIGFSYKNHDQLPFYHVNSDHARGNGNDPVVFAHMFEKFGSFEYNDLLRKILG